MALGPMLDVGIGLIFVYLLMGLIASASQELVASWLKLRGTYLRDAIADLMGDGSKNAPIFQKVYHHGLVTASIAQSLPSYLPSRTFALTVLETLGDGSQAPLFSQVERSVASLPNGTTKESLRVLLQQAAGDVDALKTAIATWYDDAMDRLSGRYKRWCQNYAAIFGLVVAIVLNVDSLTIAQKLWSDENLRSNVAAAAQAYSNENAALPSPDMMCPKPATSTTTTAPAAAPAADANAEGENSLQAMQAARCRLDASVTQLFALELPIGWTAERWNNLFRLHGGGFLLALLGWLMTAVATSLGAPFWFDMLKKALNLRGAGPKPARADAQSK